MTQHIVEPVYFIISKSTNVITGIRANLSYFIIKKKVPLHMKDAKISFRIIVKGLI